MGRLRNGTRLSKTSVTLTARIVSICMLAIGLIGGVSAYGAEQPAGTADFDYNGYSASQLKAISECIAGIPGATCPSYSASTMDHYTGTIKHNSMPTGIISTRSGWTQWAEAAMMANNYDGVYGSIKLSSDNDPTHTVKTGSSTVPFRLVGINQDNRADGRGKAGLTFQAVSYYSMPSSYRGWYVRNKMSKGSGNGGWRDSELRSP